MMKQEQHAQATRSQILLAEAHRRCFAGSSSSLYAKSACPQKNTTVQARADRRPPEYYHLANPVNKYRQLVGLFWCRAVLAGEVRHRHSPPNDIQRASIT